MLFRFSYVLSFKPHSAFLEIASKVAKKHLSQKFFITFLNTLQNNFLALPKTVRPRLLSLHKQKIFQYAKVSALSVAYRHIL